MKKTIILSLLMILVLTATSCNSETSDSNSTTVQSTVTEQSSGKEDVAEQAEEPSGNRSEKYAELAEEYKDNPELFDTAVYAYEEGIEIDEAIRRFEIMDKAGPFGAELEKNEADTFAGFWIQHEPEFGLVAAFIRDGEETLEKYREKYPELVAITELVEMKYTYAELLAAQEEASQILQELGLFYSSATMVMTNRVEIYVTNSDLFYSTLEEAGVELSDCVAPVITYEPLDGVPEGLNPDPSVHFPQLKTHSGSVMEALLIGELELVDGYLRVDGNLIIWQPDYFVHDNDGTIEIWDRDGNVVGRVGEGIWMGGGQGGSLEWINQTLKEPLPLDVTGPFWHQGDGTKLYTEKELENDAEIPEVEEYIEYKDLTPEELLSGLPAYPGSEPSTYLESGSVPRIAPLSCRTIYTGTVEPEYR